MRLSNWSSNLFDLIEASRKVVFESHPFPCVIFAADCVQAIVGVDHAVSLREFESSIGVMDVISRHGSIEAAVTEKLGVQPVSPAFLRRGDIALAAAPSADTFGQTLGVCLGSKFAFVDRVGLSFQPLSIVLLGWRIE